MAIEATQENFDQVITGPLTVVDFWAPWCGPCKMMAPILEELEAQFAGRIKFVKFNVDNGQELAQRYKVMSIPSLVVFRNGIAKEKVTGVYPEAKLAHYFNRKLDEA
ncbi:thioredoxin [Limosilactobacillus antri]|uniref:Thioredoxin n=1 Tax=Limosilactobacillus antri DSM 16041 TaxID=525309 RepID=C8P5N8_9LACO|nr:thioredoxin [Limosilactobacillus antri]EEW54209.1 thioredoxin [Limosilactobacillus antri DSM 16041]KRK60005.1 thioredoxin-1 [Limosilactobacillus antri DSM 16041]